MNWWSCVAHLHRRMHAGDAFRCRQSFSPALNWYRNSWNCLLRNSPITNSIVGWVPNYILFRDKNRWAPKWCASLTFRSRESALSFSWNRCWTIYSLRCSVQREYFANIGIQSNIMHSIYPCNRKRKTSFHVRVIRPRQIYCCDIRFPWIHRLM